MKNSEVIEILNRCKNLVVDFEVEEALQHAIKCVELLPELVQALEAVHPMNDDEPCNIYEIYNKAKELIE